MKICHRCHESKPLDQYGPCKQSLDGLAYWCRPCRNEYGQASRQRQGIKIKIKPAIPDDSHKECLKCHQVKHVKEFNKNKRGRLGCAAYCIPCLKIYQKEHRESKPNYLEITRQRTQRYRDKNREYWRSLHRINQFNRKHLIKAQSDGTITVEFMCQLYATEHCYWCKKSIPEDQRTAEHVIPLIEKGVHGVSNLKMACLSCNSSKKNVKK